MNGTLKLNVENEGNIKQLIPQPLTRITKTQLKSQLCIYARTRVSLFSSVPPKCIPLSVPDVQSLSVMQAVTIWQFRSPSGAPPSHLHDFSSRHPAAVEKSLGKHTFTLVYIKRIRDQCDLMCQYLIIVSHYPTLNLPRVERQK